MFIKFFKIEIGAEKKIIKKKERERKREREKNNNLLIIKY